MQMLILFTACVTLQLTNGWGMFDEAPKVKLKDIEVLTLKNGKMTKGRRSNPVPQLECISGGSAPCSAFKPKVVQCINKGSDGYDVQWECKTDMDNAFRFGDIEVSCEGYDYPEDPYVLQGSCGLRYTLDYTKEGLQQNKYHDYYGNDYSESHYSNKPEGKKFSVLNNFADLLVYIVIGLMIYAFYKTCISSGHREGQSANSSTNDDYPSGGGGGGYGWFGGNSHNAPPPSSTNYRYEDDASCRNRNRGGSGLGGFWTGAATGGLLGYMFGGNRGGGYGNRSWWGGRNDGYAYSTGGNAYRSRPSGGFFGGGGGSSGSSGGGGSTGTRTASGFGGTSRR